MPCHTRSGATPGSAARPWHSAARSSMAGQLRCVQRSPEQRTVCTYQLRLLHESSAEVQRVSTQRLSLLPSGKQAGDSTQLLAQGWHGSFAVRPISSSAAAAQQQRQQEQQRKSDVRLRQDSEDDAITDQIPLRPMGTVEATSYSVVIIAALGLAGAGCGCGACC